MIKNFLYKFFNKQILADIGIYNDIGNITDTGIAEVILMAGKTRHRYITYLIAGGHDPNMVAGFDEYIKFIIALKTARDKKLKEQT